MLLTWTLLSRSLIPSSSSKFDQTVGNWDDHVLTHARFPSSVLVSCSAASAYPSCRNIGPSSGAVTGKIHSVYFLIHVVMLCELHRFHSMKVTDCEGVEGSTQGFQVVMPWPKALMWLVKVLQGA
jgi:hypothetical protein